MALLQVKQHVPAYERVRVSKQAKRLNKRTRPVLANSLWYVILIVGAIVSLFPYYLAFLTSLKPTNQVYAGTPWSWPGSPTLANYTTVLSQYNFPGYVGHTLIFALASTLGQLFFSTFAAYAFARMSFPGRDTIFWL